MFASEVSKNLSSCGVAISKFVGETRESDRVSRSRNLLNARC